jgi:hypothetical protein
MSSTNPKRVMDLQPKQKTVRRENYAWLLLSNALEFRRIMQTSQTISRRKHRDGTTDPTDPSITPSKSTRRLYMPQRPIFSQKRTISLHLLARNIMNARK